MLNSERLINQADIQWDSTNVNKVESRQKGKLLFCNQWVVGSNPIAGSIFQMVTSVEKSLGGLSHH